MIWVYAIRFGDGIIYVGLTKDLDRRMAEHRRRQCPSTRRFKGAFSLVYTKPFETCLEARRHEKFMKSGAGRRLLKGKSARA
jgi:putative endonuclease